MYMKYYGHAWPLKNCYILKKLEPFKKIINIRAANNVT